MLERARHCGTHRLSEQLLDLGIVNCAHLVGVDEVADRGVAAQQDEAFAVERQLRDGAAVVDRESPATEAAVIAGIIERGLERFHFCAAARQACAAATAGSTLRERRAPRSQLKNG